MVFSLPTTANGMMSCVAVRQCASTKLLRISYLDLDIDGSLFIVEFIVIVGIHFQVVESKFLFDSLLERLAFLKGERIGFGDDGNDIDNVGQLFQDHDVDRFETKKYIVSFYLSTGVARAYACPDGCMKNKQQ